MIIRKYQFNANHIQHSHLELQSAYNWPEFRGATNSLTFDFTNVEILSIGNIFKSFLGLSSGFSKAMIYISPIDEWSMTLKSLAGSQKST